MLPSLPAMRWGRGDMLSRSSGPGDRVPLGVLQQDFVVGEAEHFGSEEGAAFRFGVGEGAYRFESLGQMTWDAGLKLV